MADVEVIPAEDFTGFPDGKKRQFKAGQPETVPADYAELLRDKGHLQEADAHFKGAKPERSDPSE